MTVPAGAVTIVPQEPTPTPEYNTREIEPGEFEPFGYTYVQDRRLQTVKDQHGRRWAVEFTTKKNDVMSTRLHPASEPVSNGPGRPKTTASVKPYIVPPQVFVKVTTDEDGVQSVVIDYDAWMTQLARDAETYTTAALDQAVDAVKGEAVNREQPWQHEVVRRRVGRPPWQSPGSNPLLVRLARDGDEWALGRVSKLTPAAADVIQRMGVVLEVPKKVDALDAVFAWAAPTEEAE